MGAGGDWSTFNALSIWPRRDRASLYGSNDVAAGRPNLLRMAAAYLCQPIFIVQVCSKWSLYAEYMLCGYQGNVILTFFGFLCCLCHQLQALMPPNGQVVTWWLAQSTKFAKQLLLIGCLCKSLPSRRRATSLKMQSQHCILWLRLSLQHSSNQCPWQLCGSLSILIQGSVDMT